MNTDETMKMQVNVNALMQNLRHAFTEKHTFLAELMQNARRAGATCIRFDYDETSSTLTAIDDGDGIENLQVLIQVADSGWDQTVREEEHPYGLGFLSALYQAETVTVTSRGKTTTFRTEDALAFQEIAVYPAGPSADRWCTEIRLTGVPKFDYEAKIIDYAKGFPIRVFFGDTELERPYAIDCPERIFHKTEIGQVSLFGFDRLMSDLVTDPNLNLTLYADLAVFLQGICVYSSLSLITTRNVIHLDARQFLGRMPDRTTLENLEEVIERCSQTIKALWQQKLSKAFPYASDEEVAEFWLPLLGRFDLLDLFNTREILPKQWVQSFCDLPYDRFEWAEDDIDSYPTLITSEALKNGLPLVRLTDYSSTGDSSSRWQADCYAWAKKLALVVPSRYSEIASHWASSFIRDLDPDDVSIKVDAVMHEAVWADFPVLFVEGLVLDGPFGPAPFARTFLARNCVLRSSAEERELDSAIIVPIPESSEYVDVEFLGQISYFESNSEQYDERLHDETIDSFRRFVHSEMNRDPVALVNSVVSSSDLRNLSAVQGKRFILEFDANGQHTVRLDDTTEEGGDE